MTASSDRLPQRDGLTRVPALFVLSFLPVLIALVYWAGLDGGYVFDDFNIILNNPSLHVTSINWSDWMSAALSTESGPIRRPLAMLSFVSNYFFTGLDPRPMKLTNLAIHIVNAMLVFGLFRSLFRALTARIDPAFGRDEWAALFIAASWALHPINLMAVLYIVQRMESLSHTFVFAGLWLYVLGRGRQQLSRPHGWLMILTGILGGTMLGVLCKESAILLPLYAFGIEVVLFRFRLPGQDSIDRKLLAFFFFVLALPAILGAILLLPRILSHVAYYSVRDFSMPERLLTELRVVVEYLRWIVMPDLGQLSLYHDNFPVSHGLFRPASTFLAAVAIASLLVAAWLVRGRRPLTTIGIVWFFSAHLLTATVIPLELVFEHRNYFASLGICLVLADLLLIAPTLAKYRQAGAALAVVFVLFCAGLTHLRAEEWSHPLRFAITEVAKQPQSPRATYDLARNLVGLSQYKSGSPYIPDAWTALERARKAPNSSILPNQAALILASRTGVTQDRIWWDDMQEKLRNQALSPSNIIALVNLSNCAVDELCSFKQEDMIATFAAALEHGPQASVLSVFGKYSLYVLGDPQFALRLWQEAADADPGNPQFCINLAMLQIDLGQLEEAQMQIDRLRKLSRIDLYERQAIELEISLAAQKKR